MKEVNAREIARNAYQTAKENARTEAIEWQIGFCDADYSYDDLAHYGEYFVKMAKRYGLVKEFKENGII